MKKIILFLVVSSCVFFSSCDKDDELNDKEEKFVPTDVLVKTKNYYTIDKVFGFINSFDHDVEYIYDGVYTSALPSDSLSYVLDYLNAKTYTNDGNDWFVTGYLHYQTQIITIFPKLFDIKDTINQADWLHSMEILQLTEQPGYIIFFHVPEREEKDWVNKFKEYDFVEWAELNNIGWIYPCP